MSIVPFRRARDPHAGAALLDPKLFMSSSSTGIAPCSPAALATAHAAGWRPIIKIGAVFGSPQGSARGETL